MTHFVLTFFLHQPVCAVYNVEHVYSIVLDVLHMLVVRFPGLTGVFFICVEQLLGLTSLTEK